MLMRFRWLIGCFVGGLGKRMLTYADVCRRMPTYAQVVEWGKCQLMGCFVGGLSGDELCAQSACLVCGRASLFALNSTFEFTGMLPHANEC